MFPSDALIEAFCILAASGLLPRHLSSKILQALTGSSITSIHTFSPSLPWIFGTLLVIIAGFFRLQSYRALGRHFTYELSILKGHALIVTGPYAWVRHPSYAALAALLVGNAIAISARGSWTREIFFCDLFTGPWVLGSSLTGSEVLLMCKRILVLVNVCGQVVLAAGMIFRTKKEDEMLKSKFGEQWETWAKNTPWRLLPGVY
jgi:protein-S-isoprenylcysteine O-methyltransferase Ste14